MADDQPPPPPLEEPEREVIEADAGANATDTGALLAPALSGSSSSPSGSSAGSQHNDEEEQEQEVGQEGATAVASSEEEDGDPIRSTSPVPAAAGTDDEEEGPWSLSASASSSHDDNGDNGSPHASSGGAWSDAGGSIGSDGSGPLLPPADTTVPFLVRLDPEHHATIPLPLAADAAQLARSFALRHAPRVGPAMERALCEGMRRRQLEVAREVIRGLDAGARVAVSKLGVG